MANLSTDHDTLRVSAAAVEAQNQAALPILIRAQRKVVSTLLERLQADAERYDKHMEALLRWSETGGPVPACALRTHLQTQGGYEHVDNHCGEPYGGCFDVIDAVPLALLNSVGANELIVPLDIIKKLNEAINDLAHDTYTATQRDLHAAIVTVLEEPIDPSWRKRPEVKHDPTPQPRVRRSAPVEVAQ